MFGLFVCLFIFLKLAYKGSHKGVRFVYFDLLTCKSK